MKMSEMRPAEYPPGTRFLHTMNILEDVLAECTVIEWSPTGAYLKLNYGKHQGWYSVGDYARHKSVCEILPALPESDKGTGQELKTPSPDTDTHANASPGKIQGSSIDFVADPDAKQTLIDGAALFRIEATAVAYLAAPDEEAAKSNARSILSQNIRDSGVPWENVYVQPARLDAVIADKWFDALVYSAGCNVGEIQASRWFSIQVEKEK